MDMIQLIMYVKLIILAIEEDKNYKCIKYMINYKNLADTRSELHVHLVFL